MGKTKKQHYVPRCYLENFKIANTYQINVFDKHSKENRIKVTSKNSH